MASTDEVLFVDGQAFPLSTDAKDATRDSDMLLHSNELSYQQLTSKFGPISDHLIWYVYFYSL